MHAGNQILRPRFDDDKRLNDNSDSEQDQDETDRSADRAAPSS
jgi:hypothetical protein